MDVPPGVRVRAQVRRMDEEAVGRAEERSGSHGFHQWRDVCVGVVWAVEHWCEARLSELQFAG
jgi:hypothetical protein